MHIIVVTTANKLISNSCKLAFFATTHRRTGVFIALATQRILGFGFVVVCIVF